MRLRVRFSKLGKIRFTSHRDVARIWERALRRANVSVAYSEGFSPRPKLSFGLALSTGYESFAEYLDIELAPEGSPLDVDEFADRLGVALPDGLEVLAAEPIDRRGDSLQQVITSCSWLVETRGVSVAAVEEWAAAVLAADEIIVQRERKGKTVEDDLRPAIFGIEISGAAEPAVFITTELATQPRSVRPSELLVAIEPQIEEFKVTRMHQWIGQGADRLELLPVAVPAAHAELCAS